MKLVVGLFLLAPFVGEFLLGNLTASELPLLLILAPLYGFGAVLVRELGRRAGGWPSIALLAAAYALIEEGPVDQLLWNDSYAGHDYLHGASYLPALGMSVELTQTILALHTVWSICVPIALMESFAGERRDRPWLGRTGLIVTAGLYALGATMVFWGNYAEERFLASPAQIGGTVVVIAALVLVALRLRTDRHADRDGDARPAPSPASATTRRAPAPWWVAGFALAATSAYWGPGVLVTAEGYDWVGVAVWFLVAGLGVPLVLVWSRREGWDQRHHLALAAGAVGTYVWTAFPVRPEAGGPVVVDLISNAVFGTVAIIIVAFAVRAVRSQGRSQIEPSE